MRGPASRQAKDVEEQFAEAVVAGGGEPLHLVLVGAGWKPSNSVTRP